MSRSGRAAQYDAVVVGGGPAGATAAADLARRGYAVLLIDRGGRIKPCGGAVPPRLLEEFDVPGSLLVAKARRARIVAPSGCAVDMAIAGGYVGMVDRGVFDEWLRERATAHGADRVCGRVEDLERDSDGMTVVQFRTAAGPGRVRARAVIGADGAVSTVARRCLPELARVPYVYAYHEIVRSPPAHAFDGERCDVYYDGRLSPDFYAWIFPHGDTVSVGSGSACKGFGLKEAVAGLRARVGLAGEATVRCEGAPIPLRPLARWDNGRDVVLAGDAAGVVAPASGEGIYYAMASGRLAAEAVMAFLASGDGRALAEARRRFMRTHGRVFWILGIMQRFWYRDDNRRERFVCICRDPDVQHLTWQAYMHKKLVRARPLAHVRIFFKDLAHLLGLARVV